jgi:hypothetical protein
MQRSAMLLSTMFGLAAGHGSLTIPQVRNSIDRHAPQWKGVRARSTRRSRVCAIPCCGCSREKERGSDPSRRRGQGYPKVPDFPGTGRWGLPNETCGTVPWSCQEGCSCSNGTSACDVGQSCFWFSSGESLGVCLL